MRAGGDDADLEAGLGGAQPDAMITYKTYDGIEDVASSDSEPDEAEAKEMEAKAYSDDLMFDTLKDYIPSGKDGRHVLLASILMQCGMVVLLFFGFHRRDKEFVCCNMYAVAVACLFVLAQLFYYFDWANIDGDNPAWHRANLYAPAGLFIAMFVEWAAGTGGMLAHAIDIDLFGPAFADLDTFSQAAFVVDSATGLVALPLLFVLSWAHRNALGSYYYNKDESDNEKVELTDVSTSVQGTFPLRSWVKRTARLLAVDTPRLADHSLPRVITIVTLLQVPFYGFAAATYANGNQSNMPIVFLALGAVYLILSVQYSIEATSSRKVKTRKWHRRHMFFPIAGIYIGLGAYMFTMSSVFFKNAQGAELWEDIISNLDAVETLILVVTSSLLLALFLTMVLLSNLHRKGWSEGQRDLEMMLAALEQQAEVERQKEEKRMKRLLRMGLVDASGNPVPKAEQKRERDRQRMEREYKRAADAGGASGATRRKRRGHKAKRKKKAPAGPPVENVSISFSHADDRVTRPAQKIVPTDQKYTSADLGDDDDDDAGGSPRRQNRRKSSR